MSASPAASVEERMTNIARLVERLEAATGPDRELDLAIGEFVGEADHSGPAYHRPFKDWARHYTESIDVALTLLPEWASCELTRSAAGPPTFTRAKVWDWRRSPPAFDPGNEWKAEGNRPLPVNLCIAALKARQALARKEEQT